MKVISRSVPAFGSANSYPPPFGNDSDYSTVWRSVANPSITNPKWLAYDLSSVPTVERGQVMVWWSNNFTGDYLSSPVFYAVPRDYTIQANAAPGGTLPSSGWVTLVTVTSNTYPVRAHSLDLTGYNWLRMSVTASNGSAGNTDAAFQLDVFDAHLGSDDSWLFLGDSITLEGLLPENIDGSAWTGGNLAQLINTARPRYPLIVHAGNGGMNMPWADTNKTSLIAPFSGRYVSIAYGTNDANQSGALTQTQIAAYYNSLLSVVDYVISLGKVPVVPKIPWGCTSGLATNSQALNNYVDTHLLTDRPQALRGPDLWTYFKNNPGLLRDCIHPTFSGAGLNGYEQMQRQWRDWMLVNVY